MSDRTADALRAAVVTGALLIALVAVMFLGVERAATDEAMRRMRAAEQKCKQPPAARAEGSKKSSKEVAQWRQ